MISVTQSAVTGFAAGSASRTLTIAKATQSALSITTSNGMVGQEITLTTAGGNAGATTYALSGDAGCTLVGARLLRSTVGSCTVTATRPGDDNYLPVTSPLKSIAFVSAVHGTVDENGSMTLVAPAGTQFSSVLFASYGTPDGSNGNFTVGWCHASESVPIVENLSFRQTSVTIHAGNGVFGDPCGGTYKRLYVSLAFEPLDSLIVATQCSLWIGSGTNGDDTCERAFILPGASNTTRKWYDFKASAPYAVWVDLGGYYHLSKFQVWTADDMPGRDPTTFELYSTTTSAVAGDKIAEGVFSCPTDRRTPCAAVSFMTTEPQRYLIVRFTGKRDSNTGGFQISRAVFSGLAGAAPQASASTSSTDVVEEVDQSEPPVDESAPPSDETEPLVDETTTDDGESGDDPLIEDAPLIGVLAMGARAVAPTTRSAKRQRRSRRRT